MSEFTKEESRNFIIGLCVLGVSLLIALIIKLDRNKWKGAEDTDYSVFATFNHTDGLSIGDKVRLAGIDVGYVNGVQLDDDFRATLELKIRKEISIPDDSSAAIVSSGIMGKKYIEVEPGGSEDFIADKGEFSFTQDAIILEELIDRVISLGKAKRKSAAPQTDTQEMEN
ncbi:MAG: MCE family protein [Alphaproteobacteria bacterium]|nr:MCE family protein [Alphaproteobacteria bacterium]